MAATSLTTAKGKYREGYEPLLGGITVVDYCVPGEHPSEAEAVRAALAELDAVLSLQLPDGNVGAMIVEPVLGEGGYVVPPVAWLEGLRRRCDEHGIVLIFDEVQCGMGRTGHAVRGGDVRRHPRRDPVREGHRVGSAARRASSRPPRSWSGGRTAPTARPSAATRSRARPRSPPSRCCCATTSSPGPSCSARAPSSACACPPPRSTWSPTCAASASWSASSSATRTPPPPCRSAAWPTASSCSPAGPGENVLRLVPPLTLSDDELDHGLTILERALADAV